MQCEGGCGKKGQHWPADWCPVRWCGHQTCLDRIKNKQTVAPQAPVFKTPTYIACGGPVRVNNQPICSVRGCGRRACFGEEYMGRDCCGSNICKRAIQAYLRVEPLIDVQEGNCMCGDPRCRDERHEQIFQGLLKADLARITRAHPTFVQTSDRIIPSHGRVISMPASGFSGPTFVTDPRGHQVVIPGQPARVLVPGVGLIQPAFNPLPVQVPGSVHLRIHDPFMGAVYNARAYF